MRIAPLKGRVGLQILGLFVIAAGLPMLMLAALSQHTVETTLERSQAALLSGTAKAQGMQSLDRLRVAEQTLLATNQTPTSNLQRSPPLLAVVSVAPDGQRRVISGGAAAAPLLKQPVGPVLSEANRLQAPTALRIASDKADIVTPAITLAVRSPQTGETVLGLVNPRFLWDGVDDIPAGLWVCVLGPGAQRLFCSDESQAAEAQKRVRSGSGSPTLWPLFLRASFDTQDWSFVVGPDSTLTGAPGENLQRTLPIAAATGLLLALLLSLVQIRRTLGPLSQLSEGARAFAQRRFNTRLNVQSRDEFGELAKAFNDMAQQLEGQFEEIESLAEIDREIVGQHTLAEIHARIAQRLAQVLPGRPVGIGQVLGATAGRVQIVAASGGAPVVVDVDWKAVALAELAAAPGWLRFEGPVATPAYARAVVTADWPIAAVLPLHWGERCFGFLLVGQRQADDIDEDALRQVLELRNRGAIAASAADREETLRREARFDSLTGLLNRRGLHQHLADALQKMATTARAVAVLFIDLDRFKLINDRLGHAAGDAALRQVSERLQRCLPLGGVAARLAGDEFVVVLQPSDVAECMVVAERLCRILNQVLVVEDNAFAISASIGVTVGLQPDIGPEQLLRQADQAMYEAKRHGGNRYERFDQQLDAAARKRLWIEQDLPLAAGRGQLRLLYQPRVTRSDGRLDSVEALIRWHHPEHGLCMPGDFIPIAEGSDLIEHLGRWVIDTACAQIRAWSDQGIDDVRIAVNLSARQLGSDRLLADLDSAFSRYDIPAHRIELEITEGVFVEQTESTVARLLDLRRRGILIALDDFGTGYSSMAYLRSLPIDVLKIDRSFVKDLDTDASALAVAHAIVALASSLGMRTVAEGVETPQQLKLLHELGCDEIQGYLYSRPIEAAELTRRRVEHIEWLPQIEAPAAHAPAISTVMPPATPEPIRAIAEALVATETT